MASKLLLFNNALLLTGERTLASLTENREPRRLLDAVWDGGAVKTCLEAGLWNFATRSLRIEYDPGVDPDFGFRRGFVKPSDWVRTGTVSADEYFNTPMKAHHFSDEAGYWFADIDTLYVRMVSDGENYGGDLGNWAESFARYVEAYLAEHIAPKLTVSGKRLERIDAQMVRMLKGGTAKDAQNSGASYPPEGNWNRSRRGRYGFGGRRDGGTRGTLVG